MDRGVIDLFLSRHRDSGIIFQLNSNLVIVKLDSSRCLKLILCHNLSKIYLYICNCIVHVSRSVHNLVCIHDFTLFPRLEHPAYVRVEIFIIISRCSCVQHLQKVGLVPSIESYKHFKGPSRVLPKLSRVTFDTFLWRLLSRIWLFHDMDMSEYYYFLYTKTLLIHCRRRVPWDRMCSLIKCLLKGHFRHDQSRPSTGHGIVVLV